MRHKKIKMLNDIIRWSLSGNTLKVMGQSAKKVMGQSGNTQGNFSQKFQTSGNSVAVLLKNGIQLSYSVISILMIFVHASLKKFNKRLK